MGHQPSDGFVGQSAVHLPAQFFEIIDFFFAEQADRKSGFVVV
jgi:hypothetical protein